MSKPYLSAHIPRRSRVYNRSLSLLGFILETPRSATNLNRYLIIYDDFTGRYHQSTDFHLCLCPNYAHHLSNLNYPSLQSHYQHLFQQSKSFVMTDLYVGCEIRMKKFDAQYHNARVVEIDCSLIKVSFYQRKSQPTMWIHHQSSNIERCAKLPLSNQLCMPPFCSNQNSTSETRTLYCDQPRLRKRKMCKITNVTEEDRKRLRDQSNSRQLQLQKRQSLSTNEDAPTISRANMLNAYYTNILLPKFRVLNSLPSVEHQCNRLCVESTEEKSLLERFSTNPFLLPFECKWTIIDGKPRAYRSPCRRIFYSLDDVERYLYQVESKLSIKYFVDDLVTRFAPSMRTFDPKFFLTDDLSHGLERVPVPVYNDVDTDRPDNFTYITEIRPFNNRIHMALSDNNMTTCCDCTDNCSNRMKCACFRKTLHQAIVNRDPLVLDKQKNRQKFAHILKHTGYRRKRLLHPVLSGIYECNSKCSCHREHCSNRLLQHGLFVQLQLFKDKRKGWGLRALHDLPRGTFICQYVGELLTSDQGHERAQTIDDKYQTSLDLVKAIHYDIDDDGFNDDDDDEEPFVVDGSLYSNLGKYFNHSCDPNMYIQNVFIDSHDLHFPNLALFTSTHVKAGQELTWHYNCELLPDRQIECFCGSKNCRGRLL